jgi:hypothetical protein
VIHSLDSSLSLFSPQKVFSTSPEERFPISPPSVQISR